MKKFLYLSILWGATVFAANPQPETRHLEFVKQYARESVLNEIDFQFAFDLEMTLYKVIGTVYAVHLELPTCEPEAALRLFQLIRKSFSKSDPIFNLVSFANHYMSQNHIDITFGNVRQYWLFQIVKAYLKAYEDTYNAIPLEMQEWCIKLIEGFPMMLDKSLSIVDFLIQGYIREHDVQIQQGLGFILLGGGGHDTETLQQQLNDFSKTQTL